MTNENNNVNTLDSKEIVLNLTVNDVNLILGGLGELPAKISIGLIDKVRSQASAQLQVSDQNVQ
jgi:hypothetical protein